MSDIVQIEIELLGRPFSIGAPEQEKDILLQAVSLLQDKVDAIRQQGKIIDVDKIAIMAALNIAHDLLKTKMGEGLEIASFQRRIKNMSDLIDQALKAD